MIPSSPIRSPWSSSKFLPNRLKKAHRLIILGQVRRLRFSPRPFTTRGMPINRGLKHSKKTLTPSSLAYIQSTWRIITLLRFSMSRISRP